MLYSRALTNKMLLENGSSGSENTQVNIAKNVFWDMKEQL